MELLDQCRVGILLGPRHSVSIHGALRVGVPYSLSPSMAQVEWGPRDVPTVEWEVVVLPSCQGVLRAG